MQECLSARLFDNGMNERALRERAKALSGWLFGTHEIQQVEKTKGTDCATSGERERERERERES